MRDYHKIAFGGIVIGLLNMIFIIILPQNLAFWASLILIIICTLIYADDD